MAVTGRAETRRVPISDLLAIDVETDAADPGRRSGEVAVDKRWLEPDRVEDLRAAVACSVEMPILDMTFRMPLFSALM